MTGQIGWYWSGLTLAEELCDEQKVGYCRKLVMSKVGYSCFRAKLENKESIFDEIKNTNLPPQTTSTCRVSAHKNIRA